MSNYPDRNPDLFTDGMMTPNTSGQQLFDNQLSDFGTGDAGVLTEPVARTTDAVEMTEEQLNARAEAFLEVFAGVRDLELFGMLFNLTISIPENILNQVATRAGKLLFDRARSKSGPDASTEKVPDSQETSANSLQGEQSTGSIDGYPVVDQLNP